MKKNSFLLSLLFILLITSCQKDDINDQIIGKWRWVKTIIPYGNIISNPQTTGFTKSLEFFPNRTINEYRNDTLLNTSVYKIETSNSGQVRLTSSIISSNFSLDKDSLIFNEAYLDGPVISYSRIKK
jgi:hypothetical protein